MIGIHDIMFECQSVIFSREDAKEQSRVLIFLGLGVKYFAFYLKFLKAISMVCYTGMA